MISEDNTNVSEAITAYQRYREFLAQPGIGEKGAWDLICAEEKWWTIKTREVIRTLVKTAGLSNRLALVIPDIFTGTSEDESFRTYRDAFNEPKSCFINPWVIIPEVRYYSLEDADKLAKAQEIPPDSPDRMAEIVYYCLLKILGGKVWGIPGGDTHAAELNVRQEFVKFTKRAYGIDTFNNAANDLKEQERILIFDLDDDSNLPASMRQRITTTEFYNAELEIVERIISESTGHIDLDMRPEMSLSDAQTLAFSRAFTEPFSIVDAAPGYGKTHTIAAICQVCIKWGIPVAVATFMGRAANRVIKELIDNGIDPEKMIGPNTLHSILRIGTANVSNREIEDAVKPGIFIIDEASMISLNLMKNVVRKVPSNWNIVMLGDMRQLPPIENGCPYVDIIKSNLVPLTTLDQNFRTDSVEIQDSLAKIKAGIVPESNSQFQIIDAGLDSEMAVKTAITLVSELSVNFGCDPRDILICTPQARSAKTNERIVTTSEARGRVICLNKILKASLNAANFSSKNWWLPAINDRVYADKGKSGMSANQAHKDGKNQRAYNGETGTVTAVDNTTETLTVTWDSRPNEPQGYTFIEAYDPKNGGLLPLAYAVTVHKVQGAESPAVIVIMDWRHWQINNAHVYTACSRGKKKVYVINLGKAFQKAIVTPERTRLTMFNYHLKELQ